MPDPLVSILVTVAAPPNFLHSAIDSALAQSPYPAEVVVAVNPSALLPYVEARLQQAPPHVRLFTPETDLRLGALIGFGYAASSGEYVTWLSPADIFDPRKVKLQMAALHQMGGRGVVTCGVRVHEDRNTYGPVLCRPATSLPAVEYDGARVLASLLDGRRDARTMLVHRSAFDLAGPFDESESTVPELEFAARLAGKIPFAHVPARLLRIHSAAVRSAELTRQANGEILAAALQRQPLSLQSIAVMARAAGKYVEGALAASQSSINALVNDSCLTVAIIDPTGSATSSHAHILSSLGIPRAGCLAAAETDPLQTLRNAATESMAEWIVLLEVGALPPPGLTLRQLLEASAGELDACLAVEDQLVHDFSQNGSLILRTLFRRSVLQRMNWTRVKNDHTFWGAFLAEGRLGGLPSSQPVKRPVSSAIEKSEISTADLIASLVDPEWYLRTNADVERAGLSPVNHYLQHGWRERRNPNAWFSTAWYLDRYAKSAELSGGAAEHLFSGGGSGFWSRPGYITRLNIASTLGPVQPTSDSLLRVLLPGLENITRTKQLTSAELRGHTYAAAPQITLLIQSLLSGQLPDRGLMSRFVDREWYLERNPDVANAGLDPVAHFLNYGCLERRDPNPWFNTGWYAELNPGASQSNESVLEHFVLAGAAEGRSPHPGFHLRWYARRYLPDAPLTPEVLLHFLEEGSREGAVPEPRLDTADVRHVLSTITPEHRPAKIRELYAALPGEGDTLAGLMARDWYLDCYADVAQSGMDPFQHYLLRGWREDRDPNPWFRTAFYVRENPASTNGDVCPLVHYVRTGAAEGLRPSPDFDSVWYAAHYLNADSPSTSALLHFLTTGIFEGNVPEPALYRPDLLQRLAACPYEKRTGLLRRMRRALEREPRTIRTLIDTEWYRSVYPGVAGKGADLASEYLQSGWRHGRDPNAWFCSQWYLNLNSDARCQNISPLEHFVRSGAPRGRRPHPLFDIEWYAARYLAGAPPGAEALVHFMTIGLDTGTVPDPRLATEAVQRYLQQMPSAQRTPFLQKCLKILADVPSVQHLAADNADVWPVLLSRQAPSASLPVLLLYPSAAAGSASEKIRAAAMALAPEEFALFGRIENPASLRLSASLEPADVSVTIALPAQLQQLHDLFVALRCRRAAVTSDLWEHPVIRFVRKADLPVFGNTPGA